MKIQLITLLATIGVVHCVSLTPEQHDQNEMELLVDEPAAVAAAPVPFHDDLGSNPRIGRHAARGVYHLSTCSDGLTFETESPVSMGPQPQTPVASEVISEAASGATATGAVTENPAVTDCITSGAESHSPSPSVSTPTELSQPSEGPSFGQTGAASPCPKPVQSSSPAPTPETPAETPEAGFGGESPTGEATPAPTGDFAFPSEAGQIAPTTPCQAGGTNPVAPGTSTRSLTTVVVQPIEKPTTPGEPSATHSGHHHSGTQSLPAETETAPAKASQGSRIWISTTVWAVAIVAGWFAV